MTLPVRTVVMPTSLRGQINGRLDASLLVDTPGLAGGPTVRLVSQAARAWRALCAAAKTAGHTLKATSLYDSYRPYDVQVTLFRQRFTTTPIAGATTRVWEGQVWYLRPGMALAAVPGTSNHGWGIAVDTGEERDADSDTESLDTATLNWLIANAHRFGFSWEVQSEPWHIRYTPGDIIPAAVLAYEEDDVQLTDTIHLVQRPDVKYSTETTTVEGVLASTNYYVLQSRNLVLAELAAQRIIVEALAEALKAGGGTVDMAAIDARLTQLREQVETDTRDAIADLAEGGAQTVRADT